MLRQIGSELKIKVANSSEADKSELKFEVAKVLESLRSVKINEPLNVVREFHAVCGRAVHSTKSGTEGLKPGRFR